MREKILEIIYQDNYQPLTFEGFCEVLQVTSESEKEEVHNILQELENQYVLVKNKKRKYMHLRDANMYIGKINIKAKGFGFISCNDLSSDVYVSKDDINGSLNNDEVLFKLVPSRKKGPSISAKVLKVLSRGIKYIVGEVVKENNKYYLKSDDVLFKTVLEIRNLNGAVPEHKVKVEIFEYISDKKALCDVIEIIGHKNDVGVDVASVASKYGFVQDFSKEVYEEINNLNVDYDYEYKRRRDLTSKLIVTIDGADAKDLDDAVTVEKLPNGNYLLGVYIADVSFYVRENTHLDQAAFERSTSVYLVDRVIPMLPHKLSNDLCSLNPYTEKLIIGCEMEINKDGEVLNSEIFEGYIKTYARLTYEEVNKVLKNNPNTAITDPKIIKLIYDMHELSQILTKQRLLRGSLEFNIPEGKIIVNDQGEVIDIQLRVHDQAERIIEEFMIITNETVAQRIYWLELPFLYRVHDEPNEQKLKKFFLIAKNLGYKVKNKGKKITPLEIQNILEDISEEDQGLHTVLLRMMAKAVYSEKNIGHFGLASKYYTHFTSPIRRYSDLVVHRLIRKYLFEHNIHKDEIERLTKIVIEAAHQTSVRERDAIDCENEVNDMKKAEYMEKYVGEEFEGVISSVTNFGMFVMLPNTVEGLVHVLDMRDDYYIYIEDLMMLIGERTKRKYRIGDKVKVRLLSANKQTREINFDLVYNKNIKKVKKASGQRGKNRHSGWDHEKRRKDRHRSKQKSSS